MARADIAGVSTNGVLVGYAIESTPGVKPTTFKQLHRINAVDEIAIEKETIDASALEDLVERTIAGRGTTGGTFGVTVNLTDETIDEWENLMSEWQAVKGTGKSMWYEEYYPTLSKAFFTKIEPPDIIPKPGLDQNGLATVVMTLTINQYVGPDVAIKPTEEDATL